MIKRVVECPTCKYDMIYVEPVGRSEIVYLGADFHVHCSRCEHEGPLVNFIVDVPEKYSG